VNDPTNPGQPAAPLFPTAPPTGQWAPPPPGGEIPAPTPAGPGGGRGGKGKLLAGIAALAVLGGGAYASAQLLGSDERGAGSPEEAAEQLIAALNGSDALGVIDLLPDGERDVLLSVADLAAEAQRLELLDDEGFSLEAFNGIDFEITDPEFEVEELSDGEQGSLTRVSLVGGEASVDVDGEDILANIGDLGDDLADENDADLEVDDVSESEDIGDLLDELEAEADDGGEDFVNPFSIAVIEEDGRFFPSVGFTVAEFARVDANAGGEDIDAPELGDGIEPEGADSPLAAVQDAVEAATAGDLEAGLAVLDPGELGAAQVYVPLLTDLPDPEDTGVEVEITDARVEDLGRGASRVVPTAVNVSGELDGAAFDFTLEDHCVELSVDVEDEDGFELDRTCFDEDIESDIADDVDVPEEISDLIAAVSPIEGGFVTVERDGRHFVSPIRTLVQSIADVVDDIGAEDLQPGGIIRDAFEGELSDEFDDLGESLDEAFEDAEPDEIAVAVLALLQDEDVDVEQLLFSNVTISGGVALGVGVSVANSFEDGFESGDFEDFEDEFEEGIDEEIVIDEPPTATTQVPADDEAEVRTPTGPTGGGPNGAMVLGDVLAGSVAEDGVATFTAIGVADGVLIGAQALDGSDLTITVVDAATGEQLEFDDDFNAPDPEVLAFLEEGQVVTIEVRGFAGQPGEFVVYYEQF
jgi:hypothetical protein